MKTSANHSPDLPGSDPKFSTARKRPGILWPFTVVLLTSLLAVGWLVLFGLMAKP